MADAVGAFRNFAFDENEEWKAYLTKVEIVNDDEAALTRLKAKWFKKHVNPDLDVASVTATPPKPADNTSSSRAHYSAPSSGANEPVRPRAPFSAPGPRNYTSQANGASAQVLALLHMTVILLAALYVASMLLARGWSTRLFRLHCQVAGVAHAMKFYLRHGLPPLRPFSLETIKMWAATSLVSSDVHYLMVCLMFMMQQPFPVIMMSPTILAIYHFAAYCKRSFGNTPRWKALVEPAYAKLMSQQGVALQLNAMSEVVSGFGLVLFAFATRSFLLPFMYWNLLRTRYANPDAAGHHRAAWQQVGQFVNPFLAKVPMLQRPIEWAKNWFLKPSRMTA